MRTFAVRLLANTAVPIAGVVVTIVAVRFIIEYWISERMAELDRDLETLLAPPGRGPWL